MEGQQYVQSPAAVMSVTSTLNSMAVPRGFITFSVVL